MIAILRPLTAVQESRGMGDLTCRHCRQAFDSAEFDLDPAEVTLSGPTPSCPRCDAAVWCRKCREKEPLARWWDKNQEGIAGWAGYSLLLLTIAALFRYCGS